MKIDKVAGQYNTYKVEMSWGQLMALKSALERDHADPLSDEAYAEICWYIDHLPQPGEEKDDLKARDEMGADGITKDGASEDGAGDEGDDYPLPMPPGHGDAPGGEDAGGMGDDMGGGEPGGDAPGGEDAGGGEPGGHSPVPEDGLDDDGGSLPKPPAE